MMEALALAHSMATKTISSGASGMVGWTLLVHGPFSATLMHTLPRFKVFNLKKALVKSVGELRRRKLAK